MNPSHRIVLLFGAVGIILFGAQIVFAGPPVPTPQGSPVWCYGQDDLTGECILFLGTEESCSSVSPCYKFSRLNDAGRPSAGPVGPVDPAGNQLWFCMGQDEFGVCKLFVGSETACMNVEPCRSINGQLPRLRGVCPVPEN